MRTPEDLNRTRPRSSRRDDLLTVLFAAWLVIGVFVDGWAHLVWHEIFGIEVDLEALLSPSHLTLFAGGLLVVTSPLRAAWAEPSSASPTFGQLFPRLLSATLTAAQVAFFLMQYSPWPPSPGCPAGTGRRPQARRASSRANSERGTTRSRR